MRDRAVCLRVAWIAGAVALVVLVAACGAGRDAGDAGDADDGSDRSASGAAVETGALVPATDAQPPAASPGPTCVGCNLLFVSLDTLRADHLGYAGHLRPSSPNLDRLAARSIVFEDVLAQAPTTAPSHRSIFSGRYVHEHRNRLRGVPVLAMLFRGEGYETAAFVDGAQLRRAFKLDRGFSLYDSTDVRHVAGAQMGGGFAEIAPKVVDWLEAGPTEPFFLFVHSYDVHCPYTPPEPHRSLFTGGTDPPFEIEGKCGLEYFNQLDIDAAGFEAIGALYDGGIHFADAQLQGILDALERTGLADRTVVVVTSDHGEALGERGLVGHNAVWDVHLKVPLLIAIPGGSGERITAPVQSIDILPMLAGIFGFPVPPGLAGRDWLNDPERPGEPERIRLAQTGDGASLAVVEGRRFSLVVEAGRVVGLYDLEADPEETTDVRAEHEAVVARLLAWLVEHGVTTASLRDRPEKLDPAIVDELKALGYGD